MLRALLHIERRELARGLIPRLPAMSGIDATREILVTEGKCGPIGLTHTIKCSNGSRGIHHAKAKIARKPCRNAAHSPHRRARSAGSNCRRWLCRQRPPRVVRERDGAAG